MKKKGECAKVKMEESDERNNGVGYCFLDWSSRRGRVDCQFMNPKPMRKGSDGLG